MSIKWNGSCRNSQGSIISVNETCQSSQGLRKSEKKAPLHKHFKNFWIGVHAGGIGKQSGAY